MDSMKRREFLWHAAAAAAVGGAGACRGPVTPRPVAATGPLFEETDVFVSGDGYPTYRIPSVVVTRRGTVLAFGEGRQGQGDHTQNDLVLRRSRDGGRTWDPMQLIAADRPNVLVNPTAVEDRRTGRLWLMYQRYPAGAAERPVEAGYEGDRVCRGFVVYSDDDGRTWSAPREVTRSVKRPEKATSIASGPGVGIQLRRGPHRGRLVAPFNEGPWGGWSVYAVYSDDGGATWRYGDTAPDGPPGRGNEVQVVELADGTLMLNARSQGGARCRKVAWSRDGGGTWSALADDPALIDPVCQGTIVRHGDPLDGQQSRLLFANAASATQRVNGTVRLSYDEGKTWPVSRTVYAGPFAYSCLTVLADGTVGLLYERDGYRKITFARFNLAWLTNGRDGS
jgi:sialidase-1